MVEFAIISVVLFTLIFGIIEGAFIVRSRNTVNNAVDDAARSGAVAGADRDADWHILNQLVGRGLLSAVDVDYVVVYDAANGSDGIPEGCDGDSGTGVENVCNVYTQATLEDIGSKRSQFDCQDFSGNWCPTTRRPTGDEEIGFVGVYVKGTYKPILSQVFVSFDGVLEAGINANSLQALEISGEQ